MSSSDDGMPASMIGGYQPRALNPWWCKYENGPVPQNHHLHMAPCCGCGDPSHALCRCPDTPPEARSFTAVHGARARSCADRPPRRPRRAPLED